MITFHNDQHFDTFVRRKVVHMSIVILWFIKGYCKPEELVLTKDNLKDFATKTANKSTSVVHYSTQRTDNLII